MTTDNNGVLCGLDILMRDGPGPLRGQRVGLVTNHTGRTRYGQSAIDAISEMDGVTLAALFGPEHGLRGEYDQAQIDDTRDAKTGVPVYSLYGTRHAPDAAQLQNIDILVFDIQDIGCRFYTYISTLAHVLDAAHEQGLPMVVLDRPNPITGTRAQGPLPDVDKLSFTACHSLPIRHGLTVGEMARLLHREKGHSNPLQVIACEGWRRGDWYDATGLLWVNPSPNMRSLTQATLYPGVGLLEMTNLSVGRGMDTPFEVVGAPWIAGRALAWELNAANVPGARFVPVEFTPQASVHGGAKCGGVNIVVTQRDALDPVRLGLTLAQTVYALYPNDWDTGKLNTLLANDKVCRRTLAGEDYATLAAAWEADLEAFNRRCGPCRLYEAGA